MSRTKQTVLWTSLLNEPFIALYAMMPFILRKDLLATAFQISLFTMLRPTVSLLSFYWGSKNGNVRSNLLKAGFFARLPFLFFPLFDNVWYLVFASAIYMLFSRAAIPPWMEALKRNLPKAEREKTFSLAQALGFAEGVVLALGLGLFMDSYGWKFLLFFAALLGMFSVWIQSRLPIAGGPSPSRPKPIRLGIELLRTRPDFAKFQWAFMLGGSGAMVIVPALAFYFADTLALSYKEMAASRCLFMGLGFVLTSHFWARGMRRHSFEKITALVCLGFGIFPLVLLCAYASVAWIYVGFLLYGVVQAGSRLIWNMSGPHFSKEDDSSPYSSLNILMIGLRGLVAPFLGAILCANFGPVPTLVVGSLFCMSGAYVALTPKKSLVINKVTE